MVYGAALERRFTRKGIQGSNPCPSASVKNLTNAHDKISAVTERKSKRQIFRKLSAKRSTLITEDKYEEGENTMTDKQQIKEIVTAVSELQDLKQWERLEHYFVRKPFVDSKSVSGETPAVISKKRLIDSWRKEIGTYFYATRHLIRKLGVRMLNSRRAKVSTQVEHVHYVADRGDRYAWTVKGTIDYILVKTTNGTWKISQMIFRMNDQVVRPLSA